MVETTEIEKRAERDVSFPAPLIPLKRLAQNYWWSWAADGASIFRDLDPEIWEECEHNPRQLLSTTSPYRLAQAATDPIYLERVRRIDQSFQAYMADSATWRPLGHPVSITRERPVAYFCAEYGVHNSLPLYSGGLGILAGEHFKAGSDLCLPLITIRLLFLHFYLSERSRHNVLEKENHRENPTTQ